MALSLVIVALSVGLRVLHVEHGEHWFVYVLVMVYTGGMLILFCVVRRLQHNQLVHVMAILPITAIQLTGLRRPFRSIGALIRLTLPLNVCEVTTLALIVVGLCLAQLSCCDILGFYTTPIRQAC